MGTNTGKLLAPPPADADHEYDGLEYMWTIFVFRPACESQSNLTHLRRADPYKSQTQVFKKEAWITPPYPSFRQTFTKTTELKTLPPTLSFVSGASHSYVVFPTASSYNTLIQSSLTYLKTS